jgi:transcriptional regulator with XRE-family HTH domain
MDAKEKMIAKYRLALGLSRIIEENKKSGNVELVSSLRKLAASSGLEYAIVQRISSGKKDPQYTTLLSLSEGLGMPLHQFLQGIEKISDETVTAHIGEIEKAKKSVKRKK